MTATLKRARPRVQLPVTVKVISYDDRAGGGRRGRYAQAVAGQRAGGDGREIIMSIYSPDARSNGRMHLHVNVEPYGMGDEPELSVNLYANELAAMVDGLQRVLQHARDTGIVRD